MYSEIPLQIADQDLDSDSLHDLEAQTPGLFEEIYTAINPSLAPQYNTIFLNSVIPHIKSLEKMLTDELSHHRVTQDQVDNIKNNLLLLLQLTQNRITDADGMLDQRILERNFTDHRSEFLSHVTRQQNVFQRLFCLTTPGAEARCEYLMNKLLGVYVSLGVIGTISLITLLVNDGQDKTVRDVFSWICIVTLIPLTTPIYLMGSLYVFMNLCAPCIDYYRDHIPENPRIIQGRTIATSMLGIFAQHKHRILEDFRRNPDLPPRNIRDIALKLWLLHISTAELLSSGHLQPVLEAYAKHLDTCNQSFEQTVKGDFVHRLLTFYVEPGRQQLRGAIVSSNEISQEVTLLEAITAVKELREGNISFRMSA